MRRVTFPRLLACVLLLPCLIASLLLAQETGAKRDAQTGVGRDAWQRPQEVMDALDVVAGSVTADIGAGNGYFTFHLAARVGPSGKVYAVEIDAEALEKLRGRAQREKLTQVEAVLGVSDDPRLPAGALDAVLIVNAYHEMRAYDAMLEAIYRALKPGGRLGIIDAATNPGEKRETYFSRHRVPAEVVRAEAEQRGFRFLRSPPGFVRSRDNREFWFLVFRKP